LKNLAKIVEKKGRSKQHAWKQKQNE
jgi:hypothetical protein